MRADRGGGAGGGDRPRLRAGRRGHARRAGPARPRRAIASPPPSAPRARRSTPRRWAAPRAASGATAAVEPQPDLLHPRRRGHQLPAAGEQHAAAVGLAQHDAAAAADAGRAERRLAQRPLAVLVAEAVDRAADVARARRRGRAARRRSSPRRCPRPRRRAARRRRRRSGCSPSAPTGRSSCPTRRPARPTSAARNCPWTRVAAIREGMPYPGPATQAGHPPGRGVRSTMRMRLRLLAILLPAVALLRRRLLRRRRERAGRRRRGGGRRPGVGGALARRRRPRRARRT